MINNSDVQFELRDSEAHLLGSADSGIYLILEVLNLSRVANSVVSVALAQRAMADALSYAEKRIAFGKPLSERTLLFDALGLKFREFKRHRVATCPTCGDGIKPENIELIDYQAFCNVSA